jgi:hypothetical protein
MRLKYGVAPSGELASIDEVARGKTQLTCLYCGGGLTAKKGNIKEHHFAHTGETCKFVSQRIKTKADGNNFYKIGITARSIKPS